MNRLFRIATRALSWGLMVVLSLVLVVIAKGVHPETLVAFKPKSTNDETLLASNSKTAAIPHAVTIETFDRGSGSDKHLILGRVENKAPEPPEFYAQAPSGTRLDVSTGIRSTSNARANSKVLAKPSPPQRSKAANRGVTRTEDHGIPSLPPLPATSVEVSREPDQSESGPLIVLPPPPATEIAEKNTSGPEKATPAKDTNFVAQLTAIQEQLNRLAAAQEQSQRSHQSWLESHQLLHQRELQQKLDGIEAGLRELQSKSNQAATSSKSNADKSPSRDFIVREDKIVTAAPESGRAPALMREVLQSLAEKANLNLMLSINVEGDVEMSLQNPTAGEVLNAVRNPPGYVVEKDGQKFHVPPAAPMQYQREAFLPPIVK